MRFFRRAFFSRVGWLLAGGMPAARTAAAGSVRQERGPLPDRASASPATAPPADEVIRANYDLIVVGGGISGTSAAISAARNGLRVALVHERSMLDGNSSNEVKLFPENNGGNQPWIREGGIHEELHTEERVRNHLAYVEGTMNCHWDLVLYEWVIREKGIRLYLNTHMHRAIMRDASHIRAVHCIQLGTEKTFELSAPLFVDATGDGVLAHRANADVRWGREAQGEYGEALAPEQADEQVMGNTLFFRAVDTGRPVPFKRPEWATEFSTEADLTRRGHTFIDGGYWWIEVGAPHHPIKDNEEIRHEALRQVLGVWDHIKNKRRPWRRQLRPRVRRVLAIQARGTPRHWRFRPDAGSRAEPDPAGRCRGVRVLGNRHPHTGWDSHGTNRPDRWSNIWISDPTQELPAWIALEWSTRQSFNTIQVTFDTDANRRVTLPLFRYPDCVRDYRLECRSNGGWKTLAEVRDNYVRRRVHRFDTVQSQRVRLTVMATNGASSARVYEVRVYRE